MCVSLLNQFSSMLSDSFQENISFCEKRFKVLRMGGRIAYSILMSLVHKVIAIIMCVFPKYAQHYHSSSYYHSLRAFCTWKSFRLFGDRLINFGLNTTGQSKKQGDDEETILSKMYNEKVQDKYQRLVIPEMQPKPEKLRAREIDEGICQGICLDYLSRYLHKRGEDLEPLIAIKKVSQIFCEKGSEEAQILQIISEALGLVNTYALEKIFENQKAKLLTQQAEFHKRFENAANQKEQEEVLQELEKWTNEYQDTLSKEKDQMIPRQIKQVWASKLQVLMPEMEINFLDEFSDQDKNVETIQQDWLEHLQSLPTGAYYLSLDYGKDAGHAILYIKDSDNLSFMHDPNLGTVQLSKDSDAHKIWQMIEENYHAKGYCSVNFYQCALKS